MTHALPFTEAKVRRALAGAHRAGLTVKAFVVGPDGSITVHTGEAPPLAPVTPIGQTSEAARWANTRA